MTSLVSFDWRRYPRKRQHLSLCVHAPCLQRLHDLPEVTSVYPSVEPRLMRCVTHCGPATVTAPLVSSNEAEVVTLGLVFQRRLTSSSIPPHGRSEAFYSTLRIAWEIPHMAEAQLPDSQMAQDLYCKATSPSTVNKHICTGSQLANCCQVCPSESLVWHSTCINLP